jgi:hypothetical protein
MRTLENQSPIATAGAPFLRRAGLIAALREAVDACLGTGGGIVALVGETGFGKSVLAHQFICENNDATYFDGLSDDGCEKATPELGGVSVLDETWQFKGVTEAMQKHVQVNRGVVVAIVCSEVEAQTLCGELLRSVVYVPHWGGVTPLVVNIQNWNTPPYLGCEITSHAKDRAQVFQSQNRRGIIRFRSPSGDTWTGFGRTPNWLVALEADGQLRERFRVDSAPLTQKTRRS